MKEKLRDRARLIIVLLILLIPLGLFSIILFYRDFINTLPPILVWGCIIVPIVLLFVLLRLIFKSKMFGEMLSYSFKEYHEKYKNCTAKNLKNIEGKIIDRSRYKGKKGYYTRYRIINGLILLPIITYTFIYCIVNVENPFDGNVFIALSIIFINVILVIYNFFVRMVIISPKGVWSISIKHGQFIPWEDVKSIGVTSYMGNSKLGVCSFIHVTTKETSEHSIIIKDAKGTITIKPRNKIIHHILCYWDGEITNLQNVKKWRRYVRRAKVKYKR